MLDHEAGASEHRATPRPSFGPVAGGDDDRPENDATLIAAASTIVPVADLPTRICSLNASRLEARTRSACDSPVSTARPWSRFNEAVVDAKLSAVPSWVNVLRTMAGATQDGYELLASGLPGSLISSWQCLVRYRPPQHCPPLGRAMWPATGARCSH